MSKKRILLCHRKERAVLTDILPFEVPPTFSNRGFYRFLLKYRVEFNYETDKFSWRTDDADVKRVMCLLFGIDKAKIHPLQVDPVSEKIHYQVKAENLKNSRIPFHFNIAHKIDGRTLSVIHPLDQVKVAGFYFVFNSLITYYSSVSEFSIRRPTSVARYAYFKDKLHKDVLEDSIGIEEEYKEYEQLGSYFVYKDYKNIHRFFESDKYHHCEKKYNAMVQIDINKCFDSIYTHSMPWVILGKEQTKFKLNESKTTFAGKFDELMQHMNHKETNGIVIGPEFSRVLLKYFCNQLIRKYRTNY